MARLLVTGMSGTGKSTVLAELARRGLPVVDTDDGNWSYEALTPDGSGMEQLWRVDLMTELLAGSGPLVVSGSASNQGLFYDRFDAVILLSAPVDVLIERLDSRQTNAFGRSPEERRRILTDVATVQPLLQATATLEIDATRPVVDIADEIESLAVP